MIRPHFPRASSAASGLRFCGMIEDPVVISYQMAAFAESNGEDVTVTVVVVIQPSHTRPRAVETPRQLRLQRGVVVLVLGVRVVKQPAGVLEEWLLLALGQARLGRLAAWLCNLVNMVRLRVRDKRAAPAWPSDLDRSPHQTGTHREHP